METEAELNDKILKITVMIKDKYPELEKYIGEMPMTIPDEKDPEVTIKKLREYLNSLNLILRKYIEKQDVKKSDE